MISANISIPFNSHTTHLAYGNRALPRLKMELESDDEKTRRRAVDSLVDYLTDPSHVQSAIDIGMCGTLQKLLQDEDSFVRWKSLQCLDRVACRNQGREILLDSSIFGNLSELVEDECESVRLHCYRLLLTITEMPFGALAAVRARMVPPLLENCRKGETRVQGMILQTLQNCILADFETVLQCGAMAAFAELLRPDGAAATDPAIRTAAAANIFHVSFSSEGKQAAIECGCLPLLVALLKDENAPVRAAASSALMSISVISKGKYAALTAIPDLVASCEDVNSEVRVNALKCLTCLSEAPEGRKLLLGHLDKIKCYTNDPSPLVRKCAETAIQVITWKP